MHFDIILRAVTVAEFISDLFCREAKEQWLLTATFNRWNVLNYQTKLLVKPA